MSTIAEQAPLADTLWRLGALMPWLGAPSGVAGREIGSSSIAAAGFSSRCHPSGFSSCRK